MGGLSIWHWLIILLIVVMVFGTKKMRGLGSDLGGAVKGFKEGMAEAETPASKQLPEGGEAQNGANPQSAARPTDSKQV